MPVGADMMVDHRSAPLLMVLPAPPVRALWNERWGSVLFVLGVAGGANKCRLSEAFLIEGAPGMQACDSVTPRLAKATSQPRQFAATIAVRVAD